MPKSIPFSWKKFKELPVIGILRGVKPGLLPDLAQTYLESGFHTLEITLNSPAALDSITVLRMKFPDMNIGAGTVCSIEDYNRAIEAGAQFIVTPVLEERVIEAAVKSGIPVFPGAYSPTEIWKAWKLGASAVKVFPATQLGPAYIRDIMAPLQELKLVPTGGISPDNIQDFLEAGAFGLGMGSSLFPPELVAARDWDGLGKYLREVNSLVAQSRP